MTNFIVNQTTDDGTGSITGTLSYAILQANLLAGDDTITIDSDVRLTGVMQTLINSNITIVGKNHSISGDANNNGINDNGNVRPLFIKSGTVGISDLTITNGRADKDSFSGGDAGMGGGLFIYNGNVSLSNVAFSNNKAIGDLKFGSIGTAGSAGTAGSSGIGGIGGAGGAGDIGSFGDGGSVSVNSIYNITGGDGGNGGAGGAGGAGGIGGAGSVSSVSGDATGLGGGIFIRSGFLTLNNTSFTNNTATGITGANSGQGLGGAIFIMQSLTNTNGNNQEMPNLLPIVNSVGSQPTFSGNSAANDAGTPTNNDNIYGTIGTIGIISTSGTSGTISTIGTIGTIGTSDTISTINVAPVGVNDSVTTAFNTAVSIQASILLANDTDVNSASLSITGVSGVTNGTVVFNNNGTASNTADDFVFFTPTTGFSGNASFNYTLSDGSLTDTATVTVAIGADIEGTNKEDNLVGTNGNDTIDSGAGNDTIDGGNGNDTLYGRAGIDLLYGGNGNDLLYGGIGSDILTGGNDNDIFAFAAGEGTDTITDFTKGNDLIGLYAGLSFGQLSFSGNNILVTSTNEILATLTGINTTTLTAANFVTL